MVTLGNPPNDKVRQRFGGLDTRLGIRLKILVLILAATSVPLLSLNIFWTISERQSLIDATHSRQTLITQNDANQVNDFITAKVRTLIIHSQSPSLQQFNLPAASLVISTLLYQDKDITRAALVNQTGQEVVALTSNLKNSPLQSVSGSNAFKVVTYYAGSDYISPVSNDAQGQPSITIAVPLVSFTTPQELTTLSTAEPDIVRQPQDIKGALIAQVSLESLWSSVLSSAGTAANASTPAGGYAYVVDDKGIVIAHPDSSLTNAHKDLSNAPIVSLFKQSLGSSTTTPQTLQGYSEKGVQVVATYQKVPITDWGVVFEEPTSSIYKNVNHVLYLGLLLSALAIILLGLLSFFLSTLISKPILRIARVAERIGRGNFTERIDMHRADEIGTLSASVDVMGTNLQSFIHRIDMQRRRLAVILNSTTDGILAIDSKGLITLANNTAVAFCESKDGLLIGKPIDTIFTWTKATKPVSVQYLASESQTYYDLEYTSPSGVMHFVNLIVVKASDQQVNGQTIITIHDETKGRDLENMKIDFVSMAAHELRTPLSTIRGYLELLAYQKPDDTEKIQLYVKQARKSSEELSSLISNLLDVSRIERGTLVLTMSKVDLAANINQSVENLRFAAATKHISLTYTGPHEGQYIVGDAVAIREVIGNLIDNAIKYTADEGHVNVQLSQKGDHYSMTIQDDGYGIPANALPYLFTKFYRVHGGLESGSKGTGLGLFISKAIIERHFGKITVESTYGHGSVFTVSIPVFNEARLAELHKTNEVDTDVKRERGWTTKNIAR